MKDLLITIYGGGDEAVEAAKKLNQQPQWIAASEQSPNHGDFVWAFTKDGVELAYWWNNFSNADSAGDREGLSSETLWPTHWMPLVVPDPPAA